MEDKKVNVKKNNIDISTIILIIIITILILTILGLIFYMNRSKNNFLTIEATVKYKGNNYIIVAEDNTDEYKIITDDDYNIGDRLSLTLDDVNNQLSPKEADVKKIDVISRAVSFTIADDEDNDAQTTESETTTNDNLNANTSTNQKNSSTTSTQTTEDDVVNYIEQINTTAKNSKTLTQELKQGFIRGVDFLFYGGTIKGKTFNELSTKAKLKTLKLFISLDSKIDEKFPNYKNTLSTKYQNIKTKTVEKYLDLTADACEKNLDACSSAKEGLADLKKNFSITWSFIKDAAGSGTSKLKSWYEVWRESK